MRGKVLFYFLFEGERGRKEEERKRLSSQKNNSDTLKRVSEFKNVPFSFNFSIILKVEKKNVEKFSKIY